jgi:hypothetical protein
LPCGTCALWLLVLKTIVSLKTALEQNLLLASLLTGDTLLFISNHGCAKTHVPNKVAQSLEYVLDPIHFPARFNAATPRITPETAPVQTHSTGEIHLARTYAVPRYQLRLHRPAPHRRQLLRRKARLLTILFGGRQTCPELLPLGELMLLSEVAR